MVGLLLVLAQIFLFRRFSFRTDSQNCFIIAQKIGMMWITVDGDDEDRAMPVSFATEVVQERAGLTRKLSLVGLELKPCTIVFS